MGILRRLREWREESDGTLTGPALNTEEAGRGEGNLWEENSTWAAGSLHNRDEIDDVSSSSFTILQSRVDGVGSFPLNRIPDGATLYGNFYGRADSGEGEYRPIISLRDGSGESPSTPSELEVSVDEDSRFETGWQEITAFDPVNWSFASQFRVQGRVTDGGTLESRGSGFWGLMFEWRVD